MKKIKFLGISLILGLVLLMGGCGSSNELDFRSVLDTETGTILSLGDRQADFDAALGQGIVPENARNHVIHYGDLAVFFNNDRAVEITIRNMSERFEFRYVSMNVTNEELEEYFVDTLADLTMSSFHFYSRFFDSRGRLTTEENARYVSVISLNRDDRSFQSMSIATWNR